MMRSLRGLSYDVSIRGEGNPILLLHGFTGSRSFEDDFPALPGTLVTPSLLHHGKSASPSRQRSTMSQQVKDLSALLALDPRPWTVIGYSLGGRIGMTLAMCDARVDHFIGISTTPGLLDASERKGRRQQDERLARLLEEEGMTSFVARWETLPLWHQTDDMRRALRPGRLAQSPMALATSLRAIGTGHMPSLWHQLHRLPRTDFIVGQYDYKFQQIARQMQERRPDFNVYEISHAGHAPHIENAREFGTIIEKLILGGN